MAHEVHLELPSVEISSTDATFTVYQDGQKFGELRVSKGAVVWFPSGTKTKGYKLNWREFNALMKDQAGRGEAR
jgi:hypothetical protein